VTIGAGTSSRVDVWQSSDFRMSSWSWLKTVADLIEQAPGPGLFNALLRDYVGQDGVGGGQNDLQLVLVELTVSLPGGIAVGIEHARLQILRRRSERGVEVLLGPLEVGTGSPRQQDGQLPVRRGVEVARVELETAQDYTQSVIPLCQPGR